MMGRLMSLALVAVLTASCSHLNVDTLKKHVDTPKVTIKSFDIKGISLRDVDLQFDIEITNPYPIDIKLEKATFKVDVEQKQLLSMDTPSGFTVKAKGSAVTPLVLNLEFAKIIGIVEDFTKKETLVTDIAGELYIPLPKIEGLPRVYKFPFKVSKKIPAIKPNVSLANFKVKAPSLQEIQDAIKASAKKALQPQKVMGIIGGLIQGKGVDTKAVGIEDLDLPLQVTFDINLKNDARAVIAFDKMNYTFSINGEQVFVGDTNTTQNVDGTLVIGVTNTLSSKKLGTGVVKVFKDRKGQFKVEGGASFNLPAVSDNPLKLTFDEAGTFSL